MTENNNSCRLDPPKGIRMDMYNMDAQHAVVEMMLSSLYIDDYTTEERTLVASNDTLEYRYTKGPRGNEMVVWLKSLEKMELPLVVSFGSERFKTKRVDCRGVLDISGL